MRTDCLCAALPMSQPGLRCTWCRQREEIARLTRERDGWKAREEASEANRIAACLRLEMQRDEARAEVERLRAAAREMFDERIALGLGTIGAERLRALLGETG